MTQAHTKGPLRVNPGPDWFSVEARFFTVTNSEGLIVAFCKDWQDGPEPEANAHLFAAAPELLEALENIDAVFVDDMSVDHDSPVGEAILAARALIAKVRGEA